MKTLKQDISSVKTIDYPYLNIHFKRLMITEQLLDDRNVVGNRLLVLCNERCLGPCQPSHELVQEGFLLAQTSERVGEFPLALFGPVVDLQ